MDSKNSIDSKSSLDNKKFNFSFGINLEFIKNCVLYIKHFESEQVNMKFAFCSIKN